LSETILHTDRELADRIAAGDEEAFRIFFHRYNERLFPFVRSLVRSEEDAREIMQDVFLKVWTQRAAFTRIENPAAWLRTVMANSSYELLRQQARYEIRLNKLSSQSSVPSADEFWGKIDSKEAGHLMQEALRAMPLRRRQIFQMSKLEGYSRREIAEQLQISENTVRNQLADAMDFMQTYMRKAMITALLVKLFFQ
jgi:RNA polymerase sigma-70 factor (family 1)